MSALPLRHKVYKICKFDVLVCRFTSTLTLQNWNGVTLLLGSRNREIGTVAGCTWTTFYIMISTATPYCPLPLERGIATQHIENYQL